MIRTMAAASTRSPLVALALYVILALTGVVAAQEVQWRPATDFELEGRGWSNTASPYDRLPDSAKDKVNETAWGLSKDSAGISVRFLTDAATVYTSWTLTKQMLDMHHMPATGVSGVDLYARSADGEWRFIGNGRATKPSNEARFAIPADFPPLRECLLNLPLYNGVAAMDIGVAGDARLDAPPARPTHLRQPIVVYGTSIAQGGCASRPGMAWPAILGRLLDRPVINLGFSGSGNMKPPVGEMLAELDPAAYIIDCIWNMGDLTQEEYSLRVSSLVQAIRQRHPQTPILFVGQSHIRPAAHPTEFTLRQDAAVIALQDQGVPALTIVPGNNLIGDDGEATVDGVHLTDIGMQRQAQALEPFLRAVLPGQL